MWPKRQMRDMGYAGSSKEWKRSWIDGTAADLVKKGHSKQFARTQAKHLYREMSR